MSIRHANVCRLDRPENRGLKGYFDKLTKAKEAIDAKSSKIGAHCTCLIVAVLSESTWSSSAWAMPHS